MGASAVIRGIFARIVTYKDDVLDVPLYIDAFLNRKHLARNAGRHRQQDVRFSASPTIYHRESTQTLV
jgi:hypothetical protein